MLQIKNLTKLYKPNQGIQDISFSLNQGEVCAVVGHNGSGKSTLFKTMLGLIHPDEGKITIQSNKPLSLSLGFLPENRSVIADLKTTELITLMARLKGMKKEKIQEVMNYWMNELQCGDLKDKRLKQCSKGNQQKIQFICALMHDPEIIILDEPFSGLDIDNTRLFQKLISKLKKKNKTILLSSHRFDEIEHLCDKMIVLKHSRVVIQGTLSEIRNSTNKQTITLSNDPVVFYKDEKGVQDIIVDNNLTHYVFKNEIDCLRVARMMLKERDHKSIKISSLTLDDLFGVA
jgi:ABC-2 type transport system ATP-binding protein